MRRIIRSRAPQDHRRYVADQERERHLTLLTANDFTGGGSLNGSGVVNVGNGGATGNLGSGNLTNNTKVTFFDNANTTYGGNIEWYRRSCFVHAWRHFVYDGHKHLHCEAPPLPMAIS